MSFLNKFFAGKNPDAGAQGTQPEPPAAVPNKPADIPTVPKKPEGSGPLFNGLAVKKKFEKPMIPSKTEIGDNTTNREDTNNDVTTEGHMGTSETQEHQHSQSVNDTSVLSEKQTAPKPAGGALSFLERMRLKKEQEEAAKLSTTQGSGQELQGSEQPGHSDAHNTSIQETSSKPRFGFIRSGASNQELPETHNTSSTSGRGGTDQDQSQSTEQPKRAIPFKFIQSKKQPQEELSNPEEHQEATKPVQTPTTGPKFSFMRPKVQSSSRPADDNESPAQTPSKMLTGLHDDNNPAEITLNLSLDRDRLGNSPEEQLADALDRVDQEDEEILHDNPTHKQPNRKELAKEAKIKPEVFVVSRLTKDADKFVSELSQQSLKIREELFVTIKVQNEKKRKISNLSVTKLSWKKPSRRLKPGR